MFQIYNIVFSSYPYIFFITIAVVLASSCYIILILKYNYEVHKYTVIFLLSSIGLLVGAKLFGFLTGTYIAISTKENINIETLKNTGIVYYGGLIGFILTFTILCRVKDHRIEHKLLDIISVCIPLFHSCARIGCYFAGCCYGVESNLCISMMYTNKIDGVIVTVKRIPIQIIESSINFIIFFTLLYLLLTRRFDEHLLLIYAFTYAVIRIVLELFRGDIVRGVWNSISFSQVCSIVIILICASVITYNKLRIIQHENN